jgi:hypothetical protein
VGIVTATEAVFRTALVADSRGLVWRTPLAHLDEHVGHMDADDRWRERRKLLLKTARV